MADAINFPGTVEWSGENPGVSLKESPDGPFVGARELLSRRAVAARARPRAGADAGAAGPEGGKRLLPRQREARALSGERFHLAFRALEGLPGLQGLTYRKLDSVAASGDPASTYSETVKAGDTTAVLTWSGLGTPFCFALPPDKSATGKHSMPSLFVPCTSATITVNGKTLSGKPAPREMAGHKFSTAMLAFSETWIRA
jgi:hypothetical protein